MLCAVFSTANFKGGYHVAGGTDGKNLTESSVEHTLRYYSGVGAGDDDGVGVLAVFGKILTKFCVIVGLQVGGV